MTDFAGFMRSKSVILAEYPDVTDCTTTDLPDVLSHIVPEVPPADHHVYRCHLAQRWVETLGLPTDLRARTLVSQGVRDSLRRLFAYYAERRGAAMLPEDVYPVYQRLANETALDHQTYRTLPTDLAERLAGFGGSLLLVTHPTKPRGDGLGAAEVSAIEYWLAGNGDRRAVIDAVYLFESKLDPILERLRATEQVIILHSLSKRWAAPLAAGIALVPEGDLADLRPLFQRPVPDQRGLRRAWTLLPDLERPRRILAALGAAETWFLSDLHDDGLQPLLPITPGPRYHFPVAGHWRLILKRYRLLGLPFSAFGGNDDLTILTSLHLLVPSLASAAANALQ